MIKFAWILFMAGMSLQAALPQTNAPQSTRFADFDKGYSLQFPSHWQVQREFMELDAFAAGPDQNPEKRSEANISVVAASLDPDTRLEDFYKTETEKLPQKLKAFKIIETGKTAFNGLDGRIAIYTHLSNDNIKLRVQQYFFLRNELGIIVTCTCLSQLFDIYVPIFEASLKTLRFY